MMLIRDIEKFLREKEMAPASFGRLAVNDPRFVFNLRRGATPRESTEKKVRAFMAQERPYNG